MNTQLQARYSAYGKSDVLVVKSDAPIPKIAKDEVLIKVMFSAINPVDVKLRRGYITSWPHIDVAEGHVPGWDVSGIITEVGSEVKDLKVDDAVWSYSRPAFDMANEHPESKNEIIGADGTAAQYIAVKGWKVAKKPKNYSFAQAAATPLAALTALQGLKNQLEVKSGQTLLVLNASGGVGSWVVILAKSYGLTVVGTCSNKNEEYVYSLGADKVIDYTKGSVSEQVAAWTSETKNEIDVVYDAVGGDNTAEGVKALRNGGKIVSIANGSALKDLLAAKSGGKSGCTGSGFLVQPSKTNLNELATLVDTSNVPVIHVTEMSLTEIAKAHDLVESHRVRGKVVLKCNETQ